MTKPSTFDELGKLDREIVAKRVVILAAIPTAVSYAGVILAQFGVKVPDGMSDKVTSIAALTLTLLSVIGGVVWARQGVTPDDPALGPKSSNGVALVEATDNTITGPPPEPAAAAPVADVEPPVDVPAPTGTPVVFTPVEKV